MNGAPNSIGSWPRSAKARSRVSISCTPCTLICRSHMSRRGRYAAPDYQGTLEQGERLFERASAGFADAVHQRHLLQVGFVDQLLGRLLDRLKEQRIYDEALIIITADHGASYREGMHRRNFRKENAADIILIPLIVKVPGQESGIISDRPVETVDILPTIASVLSIDTPFGVDGQSLIDFDLPERESRTFIRRNSSRIRPTEVEDLADLAELSSKRKVDRFGTGTDKGLYSVAWNRELAGCGRFRVRRSSWERREGEGESPQSVQGN